MPSLVRTATVEVYVAQECFLFSCFSSCPPSVSLCGACLPQSVLQRAPGPAVLFLGVESPVVCFVRSAFLRAGLPLSLLRLPLNDVISLPGVLGGWLAFFSVSLSVSILLKGGVVLIFRSLLLLISICVV